MKNKVFLKASWKDKVFLMFFSMLFLVLNGHASGTYYYQATANADVSAGGRVYVSEDETESPAYQTAPMVITGGTDGLLIQGGGNQTLHFYASNNEGYMFKGWKNSQGTKVSDDPHYTAPNQWVSGSRDLVWDFFPIRSHYDYTNATQINYTAMFEAITGYVQVYSSDITRGSVGCSNYNNTLNEEITITAIPDASKGVKFLGWKTSNSASAPYVATDNPYSLTVTGNAKYYAFFSEPATMVYCILKNRKTGRYLSFYGNGKVEDHTADVVYNNVKVNAKDGFVFDKSLKMISEDKALGNPMTVFKRTSTKINGSLEEGDLATDIKMSNGGASAAISIASLLESSNYPLTFQHQSDGSYKVFINYTTRVKVLGINYDVPLQSCLYDDGSSDYATLQAIDNMNAENQAKAYWDIYFLTESQIEGAFGANAKARFTQEGKYYTTMYAPFAYKLLDGVTAYYLPFSSESYNQEKNKLIFKEIASGSIVPANTAVILECQNADDPTQNRLLPVSEATPIAGASNQLLKGYTLLYSRASSGLINTVENSDLRYILSMNNAGKLGFYHYSGENMNPNKAFLELPAPLDHLAEALNQSVEELAKTFSFSFGETTGIELSPVVVDDADAPIYDLQGRRIKNPSQGIYVKKGKKFVVK